MNLNNRVQLIGIVANEPVIKEFGAGNKVARFTVETSDVYKRDSELFKETLRHTVVAWGNLAELVEKSLRQGVEVVVDGKLMRRSYTDKRGDLQFITEVVLNTLVRSSSLNDELQKAKSA
jgi:single-strand DNA-binding protein